MLRRRFRRLSGHRYVLSSVPEQAGGLFFEKSIPAAAHWNPADNSFQFLNRWYTFGERVDWKFDQYGKLWTYNLQYFEYLLAPAVTAAEGERLILDFIAALPRRPEALEPYPISLRLLFWTRFLTQHNIQNPEIDASMYAQAYILADNIEYHLLGNHYLENGFGLLFAAYYFRDVVLYKKARAIVQSELSEQVLSDGAHYERSPMYHAILLYRLLDALNLTQHNPGCFGADLLPLFREKAGLMLSWLAQISTHAGDLPAFNDTAPDIAPASANLLHYGARLGIQPAETPLGESGYRVLQNAVFQCIIDVGDVGPDYIPGHAHCDTLSVELYHKGMPFLVNTGISTYDKNERRQYERSTAAHNTVQLNGVEQSEVWGGFRVARRAYARVLEDMAGSVKATHTGYDRLGLRHVRGVDMRENGLKILDEIQTPQGQPAMADAVAYFHLAPKVEVLEEGAGFIRTNRGRLEFTGYESIKIETYRYAAGYNLLLPARRVVVRFREHLEIAMSDK
jgi:hypothetical protein